MLHLGLEIPAAFVSHTFSQRKRFFLKLYPYVLPEPLLGELDLRFSPLYGPQSPLVRSTCAPCAVRTSARALRPALLAAVRPSARALRPALLAAVRPSEPFSALDLRSLPSARAHRRARPALLPLGGPQIAPIDVLDLRTDRPFSGSDVVSPN